ncbi:NAD(P)H-hydrate dehydratase [bacterium]|nr:NAD(P)H-hydrate dehydratase [bacterium]
MNRNTPSYKITQITKQLAASYLPQRRLNSNKGNYGNVLNIAGSNQYPGAAYFSSISALKSGAGKVMLATNTDTVFVVASKSADITFLDLGSSKSGSIPKDALKYVQLVSNPDVYSIGCGLGLSSSTEQFVIDFVNKMMNSTTPIILDADALNILAKCKRPAMPLNSAITPHPMELARLLDVDVEEIQSDRIKWAWKAAINFECIVVLKGNGTVIAVPNGQVFVNTTGNSALSKAGTGDVLTGMISGFCAQGLNLENAACLAVYLHGLAGDIAAKSYTQYGVLASNLINYIPFAIKELL